MSSRSVVLATDGLTRGEESGSRHTATSSLTLTSGRMYLGYFTARKATIVTQCRAWTAGTAAATCTLARFGLYSVSSTGAGTLVGSTPSDTALFNATFAAFSKNLSAAVTLSPGQKYAIALLVAAGTPPAIYGSLENFFAGALPPRIHGYSAQADLPASFTEVSLSTDFVMPYMTALEAGA